MRACCLAPCCHIDKHHSRSRDILKGASYFDDSCANDFKTSFGLSIDVAQRGIAARREIGAVPATEICAPTCTARENPISGSNRDPELTKRRSFILLTPYRIDWNVRFWHLADTSSCTPHVRL